ncbi:MAG TPA: HAD family hydrolase, partial [Egibacteraceae bacterium]|nr:HAD family hydrolase [Egibacteraceae bacterium]
LPRMLKDAGSSIVFRLLGASDEKSEALRDRILASVAGTPQEELLRFMPAVVEELIEKVRPEAQALVDMHMEAGRDVWIISASPVEVVAELARALGMTGGLGTESEVVDGVYTGRLAAPFCYGEGKAERIHKLAAERGYDLSKCYSYSDSASDLPMMQVVGHPVAVNPDRALTAVAHRRGWPVVEFARQAKRIARLSGYTLGTAGLAGGTYLLGRRHGARRAG